MATIELKLKPVLAPDFVQAELPPGKREEGAKELPSFALKGLPLRTVDALAEQWLKDFYEKAEHAGWNKWMLGRDLPK